MYCKVEHPTETRSVGACMASNVNTQSHKTSHRERSEMLQEREEVDEKKHKPAWIYLVEPQKDKNELPEPEAPRPIIYEERSSGIP